MPERPREDEHRFIYTIVFFHHTMYFYVDKFIRRKKKWLFKYLGPLISRSGGKNTEIASRIAQAKQCL